MARESSRKISFVGIGAQKCATTWLYDILVDHPEVCLSERKELDFFSYYFDYGYQWYERQFECHDAVRATGEISPSYFHSLEAPQRLHDYNAQARLIVFLREPVARAISNHKHEVRIGHLQGDDLSFEHGLRNNPAYLEQGRYATHLERWLDYFPRERILVVLFDDIIRSERAVAERVYEFLGLDISHKAAALQQKSNESYVNRYSGVEGAKNGLRAVVRRLHLGGLWEMFGSLGARKLYRAVNRVPAEAVIPPLQPETRAFLQEYFAGEVDRLEALTGLSLAHWRPRAPEVRAHA